MTNIRIDRTTTWSYRWRKKKKRTKKRKEGRYLRREFSYSKFQQTMVFLKMQKDKIEAKVENGVLKHHHSENELRKQPKIRKDSK